MLRKSACEHTQKVDQAPGMHIQFQVELSSQLPGPQKYMKAKPLCDTSKGFGVLFYILWVAVNGLKFKLSYHNSETTLLTLYPFYGHMNMSEYGCIVNNMVSELWHLNLVP